MTMQLVVNGRAVQVEGGGCAPLLDVLRDELGDTTPKPGCHEGRCGACTVLLDGTPVLSCLLPTGRAVGAEVTTLEGIGGPHDQLTRCQETFARLGAVQCGICTPGMILTVEAMLAEGGTTDRTGVREALANNLCRCTGYQKIVDAVAALLDEDRGDGRG